MFSQARLTVSLLAAAIALAKPAGEPYDYVIIGGGTAGFTAAVRLTENSNIRVAVIEAGGTGIGNPNITDLRNRQLNSGTEVDWQLPTVPQTSAGGRIYTHTQGKTLGGSSAINGAVYFRPDVREFDAIEALGAKGWTWERFLEYFKRSEHFTATGETFGLEPNASAHGAGGHGVIERPERVTYCYLRGFFAEYAIPTIQNIDQPLNGDNSDGNTVGATSQQFNRENLKVFTDSLVSKIIWGEDEDGLAIATGVEYITDNRIGSLSAKSIIVSAGALNTPKLLELSGIGNASHLESLGIDVKVDNTGVGNNLQNHISSNVAFKLKDGVVKGSETQAAIIDLVSAQQLLTEEDQAKSTEILSTANNPVSQSQFNASKKLIADGLPQIEINWSIAYAIGEWAADIIKREND
ncbi:hypothetical protein PM082_012082 [Marasmius tenuissimus]|nr:hypothetical protein PM082_012082 [Marasmius tenuissimus]